MLGMRFGSAPFYPSRVTVLPQSLSEWDLTEITRGNHWIHEIKHDAPAHSDGLSKTGDIVATTAAVIVFWPAAFLVGGDDAQTAELVHLKGEFDAIQRVSVKKGCTTQFQNRTGAPRR